VSFVLLALHTFIILKNGAYSGLSLANVLEPSAMPSILLVFNAEDCSALELGCDVKANGIAGAGAVGSGGGGGLGRGKLCKSLDVTVAISGNNWPLIDSTADTLVTVCCDG
jgi:hypothetical protein